MVYRLVVLIILLSLPAVSSFAQAPKKEKPPQVYKDLEKYSKKRGVTKFFYKLLFRPPSVKSFSKDTSHKYLSGAYRKSQEKYIRKVIIDTHDPFGYNIGKNEVNVKNPAEKFGNSMHNRSSPITIRNLLLFKPGQLFDSSRVRESERLIRQQVYVNDIVLIPVVVPGTDSVDIYVRELDNWSTIPLIGISSSYKFGAREKNFMGLGHQVEVSYQNKFTGKKHNFNTTYGISNFRNTHITTFMQYGLNERNRFTTQLLVDRRFFSSYARWGGGIKYIFENQRDSLVTIDTNEVGEYKHFIQDYWLGKAWQLYKNNPVNAFATNITVATRFYDIHYYEHPADFIDTLSNYSDDHYYLVSLSLSSRKFVKESFVFRYGLTEFIPVGRIYEATVGYDMRAGLGQWYAGGKISWGAFYKFGYLSPSFEYGTFLYNGSLTRQTIKVGANYFTHLITLGKWKFRQFVSPEVTVGLNRLAYERLSINDNLGISGFDSPTLRANDKFLLTLQTQGYAPWHLLGFNFGPYLIMAFAVTSEQFGGLAKNKLYSQIGLGVIINNNYLVINTFQISISFYPTIPGRGDYIFKGNSYKTTDYRFNSFEPGKPNVVEYR